MKHSTIKEVKARQVLDCNGRPVVEVDILTEDGHMGRAGASTGSSVGANESFVLRDGDPALFGGLSVYKAVENVKSVIAPAILGMDVHNQAAIDNVMIGLDGTRYKTNIGGNAIFATSVAVARASAACNEKPLYLNLAKKPIPYVFSSGSNVLNGGKYYHSTQAFQEFMILPSGMASVNDAVRIIVEVFQALPDMIQKAMGFKAETGKYSGYAAPSDDPLVVFQILDETVRKLGYQDQVVYAIDCASSEYYNAQEEAYEYRGKLADRNEIISVLKTLAEKYPIAYIEDALQEEDFEGFKLASERIPSVIIGDDFLCTSMDRTQKAIEMGAAQGIIFKPNQAGTITEALATANYLIEKDLLIIPSGRAGGVLDSPEKEIGLALGCCTVKSGAPRTGSRTEGLNFAMRVAEELALPMVDITKLPIFNHLQK